MTNFAIIETNPIDYPFTDDTIDYSFANVVINEYITKYDEYNTAANADNDDWCTDMEILYPKYLRALLLYYPNKDEETDVDGNITIPEINYKESMKCLILIKKFLNPSFDVEEFDHLNRALNEYLSESSLERSHRTVLTHTINSNLFLQTFIRKRLNINKDDYYKETTDDIVKAELIDDYEELTLVEEDFFIE